MSTPVAKNYVLLAAGLVALAYGLLLDFRPYAGDVVLKTLMCGLLAGLTWQHQQRRLAVALLFSAVGDACLAIDAKRLFVPGLASFLVTHLLYCTIFWRVGRANAGTFFTWRHALASLVIVFVALYTSVLWPHLGGLALPVVLYIVTLLAMVLLALRVQAPEVPLGALLFMSSDSLIAWAKFLGASPWMPLLTWVTYAGGQLLIVRGSLARSVRSQTRL